MKLTTLQYFVAVANEKSFTKAADELYISQPTLSRRIQELETELGVKLLLRQSHTLELTKEGEQFLIRAAEALEKIDDLSHMFDNHDQDAASVVKIGYLANFNLSIMYQLLNEFKSSYPKIQFILNADTPLNLVNGLDDGEYDLVFNLDNYFHDLTKITKSEFLKNRLQIAIPLTNSLSNQEVLHFADLKNETFILLERQQSPVIVDYVINLGLQNGFNIKANYYVNNLDEGLSMVSMGKGLAFLYSGMNDGQLESKYHIKIADLAGSSPNQDIVMAINKITATDTTKSLLEFIQNKLTN
ncbi:LysR family transcriptional regulator [Lentilactobacillus kosonis]|uniref:Chromosome initiation inhibitor n=1 Tax=Lentilactobacillus kosonis TaxID=2810561 RepID=A0A401FNP9_9LACO|nr:LysR family transcriptional regulator [Lentilactobacillus kosonis]GAY73973.1 chromosome initiation inhibitor [Lentilactobacillus kosonis]